MRAIVNSICKTRDKNKTVNSFKCSAEYFAAHHPYIDLLAAIFGMPIFILMSVIVGTTLVALPISAAFGWI